jgi:hypothetical protein
VIDTAEDRTELWWLAAPAPVWLGHFIASYALVAMWCMTDHDNLGWAGLGLGVLTAVAVTALVGIGLRACSRFARVPSEVPDADSDLARHRFVALATILLSSLAIVGIGFVVFAAFVVGECR